MTTKPRIRLQHLRDASGDPFLAFMPDGETEYVYNVYQVASCLDYCSSGRARMDLLMSGWYPGMTLEVS